MSATIGKNPPILPPIDAALPPVKNRFLPTQEWSTGYGSVWAYLGGLSFVAAITLPLAAHGCEIPAYAGMVCGGREFIGEYGIVAAESANPSPFVAAELLP